MKLLVLTPEPLSAELLRRELGDEVRDAEVRVVAPALNSSPIAFWMSDSDEAIAEAHHAAQGTGDAAREAGADSASTTTGESEPLVALQDALATFPADRVAIFVHPDDDQRYREDDVCASAQERFGVTVTRHALSA
ncbi:MAG: hypothetical protein MSC31_13780 [Solirubrobacteraceae bacterium MAG38_C4-C5]|nr:hypothetical protein [Candidatus Siliceabacter maunaloa]